MPPAGFESAIPVTERPQIYASDRATPGIGIYNYIPENIVCLGTVIIIIIIIIIIIHNIRWARIAYWV